MRNNEDRAAIQSKVIGQAYWRMPADDLLKLLSATPRGLSANEAATRLREYGLNSVSVDRRRSVLVRIIKRFANPLVAILFAAAAISGWTGDTASFFIIAAVIMLSVSLDVIQEYRAENAADTLKRSVAVRADILRDGAIVALPVEDVVPGDIVRLRAGDLVPADGILLDGRAVHTNEALMTGEPYPIEKRPGRCDAENPADAFNALFAGTSLVNGEAMMLVVATGPATRFGGITVALAGTEPSSAFERGIHALALLILRLTVFLVLFVLLVNVGFGRPAIESFLFAVALAVGLTPELLPMITTVTLSRGALRMAQKQVIVKRLAAIHDLGAMDVLCTDKTGTLTEAKISLAGHRDYADRESEQVLTLAAVNSIFGAGIRSPLDQAIVTHCSDRDLTSWRKVDELPFDFDRRCASVLVEYAGKRILILKGAPETVMARADRVETGDGPARPLDGATRRVLDHRQEEYAASGLRALAIAWKEMDPSTTILRSEDEVGLVLAGFCLFVDPPKASAAPAIARLAAAGVRVKVISGDHPAVVRHVIESLNIAGPTLLTGEDIARLTDSALVARAQSTDVFARVSPDQKTRLVRALQAGGHTVGFLGDGVNDAPAIQVADVGLSVEGATDVARSAADIILLSANLGVVADGVQEGRRTFVNILKYVRMGTSSNFGNMLSMALASLILPFLPLLPVQILLNNLLYDFSEVGIPFDRVDHDDVAHPRAWDMAAVLRFTVIMGSLSSLFDLAAFFVLLKLFHADAGQFRTAWFLESMLTQILVIFIIRTYGPFWKSLAHPVLVASSLAGLLAAIVVVASPLSAAFAFATVQPEVVLAIVALVAGYLFAAEALKRRAFSAPRRLART
jgi:Mg2+-importing ATPase